MFRQPQNSNELSAIRTHLEGQRQRNGGLLTTTEDLLKWSDFYQQVKLGTSSLLGRQLETEPLNNGAKNEYAAGWL